MPVAVVKACLRMMPRLEAHESLTHASAVFAGSPQMSTEGAKVAHRLRQVWEKQRRRPEEPPDGPLVPFVSMSALAMEIAHAVPVQMEAPPNG